MDYIYQQTTSSTAAEISYWLNVANQCHTTEEKRYCYIRILEIDPGSYEGKQGFLTLGNGPAQTPRHLQTEPPIIIVQPQAKEPLYEEPKNSRETVISLSTQTVIVIFACIWLTLTLIKLLWF